MVDIARVYVEVRDWHTFPRNDNIIWQHGYGVFCIANNVMYFHTSFCTVLRLSEVAWHTAWPYRIYR